LTESLEKQIKSKNDQLKAEKTTFEQKQTDYSNSISINKKKLQDEIVKVKKTATDKKQAA